jgi:broad specificity phosphatase PhoE
VPAVPVLAAGTPAVLKIVVPSIDDEWTDEPMGNVFLVRHGQASFGAEDYDALSPLGVSQSEQLGRWLAAGGMTPWRVCSGAMKRHRQTAMSCLTHWNLPGMAVQEDPRFDEFDFRDILAVSQPDLGDWSRVRQLIATEAGKGFQGKFSAALRQWIGAPDDAGYRESWPAFKRRCLAALEDVGSASEQGDVWVFTSGGPIAVMVQGLLEISDRHVLDLNKVVRNGAVTQVIWRGGRGLLAQFNAVGHLAPGDLSFR